jgi:hypothetical protein
VPDYVTWETLELPLLEEIWQAELEGRPPLIAEFFKEREIPVARAQNVIDRLRDADMIDGVFSPAMQTHRLQAMMNVHLAPAGARAVGVWPSGDAADAFVAALEAAIERAEKPDERSRLEGLLDAFRAVPAGVMTQVAAAALMRAGGIG